MGAMKLEQAMIYAVFRNWDTDEDGFVDGEDCVKALMDDPCASYGKPTEELEGSSKLNMSERELEELVRRCRKTEKGLIDVTEFGRLYRMSREAGAGARPSFNAAFEQNPARGSAYAGAATPETLSPAFDNTGRTSFADATSAAAGGDSEQASSDSDNDDDEYEEDSEEEE